jgi:hypothetical protein
MALLGIEDDEIAVATTLLPARLTPDDVWE